MLAREIQTQIVWIAIHTTDDFFKNEHTQPLVVYKTVRKGCEVPDFSDFMLRENDDITACRKW